MWGKGGYGAWSKEFREVSFPIFIPFFSFIVEMRPQLHDGERGMR